MGRSDEERGEECGDGGMHFEEGGFNRVGAEKEINRKIVNIEKEQLLGNDKKAPKTADYQHLIIFLKTLHVMNIIETKFLLNFSKILHDFQE